MRVKQRLQPVQSLPCLAKIAAILDLQFASNASKKDL